MSIRRLTAGSPEIPAVASIFQPAFSGPPWNEPWTHDRALQTVERYVSHGADLLVFYRKSSGIESFVIAMPLTSYFGAKSILRLGVTQKAYWIAELATAAQYRRRGNARALTKAVIDIALAQSYRTIGARSHVESIAANIVFSRAGLLPRSTQRVTTRGVRSTRTLYIGRF